MNTKLTVHEKGDPSAIPQKFQGFNLQILCCRYWWLKNWEYSELSYPFWRIYHNPQRGAFIKLDEKIIELTPDKLYMIAPNTSYSSWINNHEIPEKSFNIEGGRVENEQVEHELLSQGFILHLFIHFNIGMPYDNVTPGIYSFRVTEHMLEKLGIIKNRLYVDFTRFSFYSELAIQSLISDLLAALPMDCWNIISKDGRIMNLLKFIQNNLDGDLSNTLLAKHSKLATNAFTRMFTERIGIAPQRYVKKTRIDKACVLLHHTDSAIDEIAIQTGFADRYHFSRVFHQITGFSPAKYRKGFALKE